MRPSIPRHHYLKLIAKASASVRARLEAANPDGRKISLAVQEVTRRARSAPVGTHRQPPSPMAWSNRSYEDGRLDEHQVAAIRQAEEIR